MSYTWCVYTRHPCKLREGACVTMRKSSTIEGSELTHRTAWACCKTMH
jgi:hypothetical protein